MKKSLISSVTVLALLFSSALTQSVPKICRALALSGGANRGAYEAGVIKGLSMYANSSDIEYDVVSGVSAGSFNSFAMSLFDKSDHDNMSDYLVGMWQNITNEQVFQLWKDGAYLNHSGILDNSPMREFLYNISSKFDGFKRRVIVGAVDANSGEYVTFSEQDSAYETFPDRVIASGSLPFIFPPKLIDNYTLMDGGVGWGVNLESVIDRCMEIVDDESEIVLDVALCYQKDLPNELKNETSSALNNYLRYLQIGFYGRFMNNVWEVLRGHPKVQFRYLFMPTQNLGYNMLDFSYNSTHPMIEIGISDVQKMIGQGQGVGFEKVNNWFNDHSIRKGYQSFNEYLHDY